MRSRRAVLLVALAALWIACDKETVVEPDNPEIPAPRLNKAPVGEPQTNGAENAAEIIYACYNPSGSVYRIKTDDPDEECRSPSHMMFSWNEQGPQGPPGADGADGLHCWDLNGNGVADLPDEDVNGDTVVDVLDCKGDKGDTGDTGPQGPPGVLGFYTTTTRVWTNLPNNSSLSWYNYTCSDWTDYVINTGYKISGASEDIFISQLRVENGRYFGSLVNRSGSSIDVDLEMVCADIQGVSALAATAPEPRVEMRPIP